MHLRAIRAAQVVGQDSSGLGPVDGSVGVLMSTTVSLPTSTATSPPSGSVNGGGGSSGGNSSSLNVTAHFLDDDVEEYGLWRSNGFSEMQTVALACIATLIPLFFILVAAFAVRFVWRKFRGRRQGEGDGEAGTGTSSGRGYDGILQRDESAEAAKAGAVGGGGTSATGSGAQLLLLMPDELKTSESQFSVTPGELDDVTSQSPLISGGSHSGKGCLSTVSNHKGIGTSKSANGSVITMTLQNNHLIVETEELASLPMVDDCEPSPPHTLAASVEDTAQIHYPPPSVEFRRAAPEDDLLDDDEDDIGGDLEGIAEEDEEEVAAEEQAAGGETEGRGRRRKEGEDDSDEEEGARGGAEEEGGQAGLSQSDLSDTSSIGASNPTYRYGNQVGYASGQFGYPQYAGYEPPKATPVEGIGEEGSKRAQEGGGWSHDAVNGDAGGDEDEEEEKRHQRVQEQLGGTEPKNFTTGHHRTGSLPKPAADDSIAIGVVSGMSEMDKMRCNKRRSLPIITTHAPTIALGGFKKLLNEEEEEEEEDEEGRRKGDKNESGSVELEVVENAAPESKGGSDGAALPAVDAATNSGEHENEAFVETD